MATVYGVNRTIYNDPTQSAVIDAAKNHGTVHYMYDEYEAAALAGSDVIQVGDVLPDGAVVLDIQIDFDDLGAGLTLDVGDSNDVDRYLDGVDTATAAGKVSMRTASATIAPITGMGYVVGTNSGDNQIQLTNLGGAATGTIKVNIIYSVCG
jgi:hypothetical protein